MSTLTPSLAWVRDEDAPRLPPPPNMTGIAGWIGANMFPNWYNGILSVVFVLFVAMVVGHLIDWALLKAVLFGEDRTACVASPEGACWAFVRAKLPQWIYGFYPIDQRWRVNLAFLLGAGGLVPMLIPAMPRKRENALYLIFIYPIATLILLTGGHFRFAGTTWLSVLAGLAIFAGIVLALFSAGLLARRAALKIVGGVAAIVIAVMLVPSIDFGLTPVETSQWGGLLVTLVVAITGIVTSLPLGILLALGRRSEMPAVRVFSVVFIEVWRGVPLITVLFMASVMLPLFLPEGVNFDKLLRCLIGVALFSSAYMAEVVRGGLQAIPKGQYEAANALGLPIGNQWGPPRRPARRVISRQPSSSGGSAS